MEALNGMARSGVRTSEFWLTLAGNVAALITTLAGLLPAETAGWLVAVANGLYAISRGIAKKVG